MGRGKQDRVVPTNAVRRRSSPAPSTDKTLSDYERTVMPAWHRFASATGGRQQAAMDSTESARARTVRKLPVATQLKLIEVAQGATAITEAFARTVACPTCQAKVGSACRSAQREREISHPDRLRLAQEGSSDKSALTQVARAQAVGAKARELFIYSHTYSPPGIFPRSP